MHKDVATRLVMELRSGKYEKGTGALKATDNMGISTHCCLGVLCEIAAAESVTVEIPPVYGSGLHGFGRVSVTALPPDGVREWAGAESEYSVTIDARTATALNVRDEEAGYAAGDRVALPHINDNSDLTFNDIADLIEKEYVTNG